MSAKLRVALTTLGCKVNQYDTATIETALRDGCEATSEARSLVTYRGLKDGLDSTREFVTGRADPPRELRLL